MALNKSFAGFVYDKDNVLVDANTYFQAYFYNNGTASSVSTWNSVRQCEQFTGYYAFNLGDLDFLGQEGLALSGSTVLIAFWKGGPDRTSDCGTLTEWGAFEVEITNSDTYVNATQTMDNIDPDLHWTTNIPSHPYVDTTYTVSNTSEDEHSWVFNTLTMNHWYSRYSQIINGPNTIDSTDIYWGDTQTSLGLPGAAGDTHQYDVAGTYEITVEVFDNCSASVSGTDSFDIYWHEPVPNIIMIPSDPLPNEVVTFEYTGTDVDDRITSIAWVIGDSGAYGNTDTTTSGNRDDTISHSEGLGTDWYNQAATSGAFTNPGTHLVAIAIYWNDGFNDQVMNYSENFTQDKFTGPTIDFTQLPVQAAVSSGVAFNNTSTNVSRVGLGLPDNEEYTWTWDDDGVVDITSDVAYSYQLNKVPNSAECTVKLCADWSDGWDTMMSCLEKSVAFRTTVTVTPEDCYYRINVIGTSDDGTTDGYSWTVSSGTSASGTWNEVWSSPVGLSQQDKTLCFSSTGWYKIEGFVYGTGATTNDFQTLFVDETCPDSGSVYTIWNGTGPLDTGSDWVHIGHGVESPIAVYRGTNGMLVTGSTEGDEIVFHRYGYSELDINNYDFLSFWINIKDWEVRRDMTVRLFSTLDNQVNSGIALDLSNYVMLDTLNEWQRVMIPLKRFRIEADEAQVGWPTHANSLEFYIEGAINFWMDDIALIMGELITLPVCTPDMETTQVGSSPRPPVIMSPCSTAYPGPINI